ARQAPRADAAPTGPAPPPSAARDPIVLGPARAAKTPADDTSRREPSAEASRWSFAAKAAAAAPPAVPGAEASNPSARVRPRSPLPRPRFHRSPPSTEKSRQTSTEQGPRPRSTRSPGLTLITRASHSSGGAAFGRPSPAVLRQPRPSPDQPVEPRSRARPTFAAPTFAAPAVAEEDGAIATFVAIADASTPIHPGFAPPAGVESAPPGSSLRVALEHAVP